MLFIESPQSVEEMERIGSAFGSVPLLANMVEGGRAPVLDASTLQTIGYRIAIYPALGFLAATAACERTYTALKANGSSVKLDVPLYKFRATSTLMGFGGVAEFDRKYRGIDDAASST